jgi:myo-inositol catabolism protein IolC
MTMPSAAGRYVPSAGTPLFLLAMDHRSSFAKTVFGLSGEPTAVELERMRDAKLVIYEGAREAVATGLPVGRPGVLVDEHLGSEVAKRAKADGLVLAMPIEKSGTKLLELEYGERFAEHVEEFDPDFFKVLARYNPADSDQDRATQIERLSRVSTWATDVGRHWLLELLVPPTSEQLVQSEDQYHFDREVRPGLTVETISALVAGQVHPTIWKLEGYETSVGAEEVLRTVAADIAHPAQCIVLGRDAPMSRVEHWIDVAAPLPGYAGFAVGRSIWEEALLALIAGKTGRSEAVRSISTRYRTLIDTYYEAWRKVAPS